jgi:hypothetical protein
MYIARILKGSGKKMLSMSTIEYLRKQRLSRVFSLLPNDMIFEILQFVALKALSELSLVQRRFNRIINSESFLIGRISVYSGLDHKKINIFFKINYKYLIFKAKKIDILRFIIKKNEEVKRISYWARGLNATSYLKLKMVAVEKFLGCFNFIKAQVTLNEIGDRLKIEHCLDLIFKNCFWKKGVYKYCEFLGRYIDFLLIMYSKDFYLVVKNNVSKKSIKQITLNKNFPNSISLNEKILEKIFEILSCLCFKNITITGTQNKTYEILKKLNAGHLFWRFFKEFNKEIIEFQKIEDLRKKLQNLFEKLIKPKIKKLKPENALFSKPFDDVKELVRCLVFLNNQNFFNVFSDKCFKNFEKIIESFSSQD